MLTCPCNVDPLTPSFYFVKIGFNMGIQFFLIFAEAGIAPAPGMVLYQNSPGRPR